MRDSQRWPSLPLNEWQSTYDTLHLWTQIVGKVRMTLSPPLNHWWHVTLYVSANGLTTGPIPYPPGLFEIEFDFQKHVLETRTTEGRSLSRRLEHKSVAAFYTDIFHDLAALGIDVSIDPMPQEIPGAVPFDQDSVHRSYDPEYANRFWRILVSISRVMQEFRAKFVGKCSPVHFFWGSFDLACSRFSGRPCPPPPRHGVISGPAYSHEVSSAGFWPGGSGIDGPAFYAYTVPKPDGLDKESVRPASAGWNPQLSEFILMYDEVRRAASPENALTEFLESTYEAGARLAKWDRSSLEGEPSN